MAEAAHIRVWEEAEIERSIVEAAQTPVSRLETDENNIRRYLNPPADTPYPLEYVFHLVGDVAGKTVLDYGCGDGENLVPLVRRGADVVALDVSKSLLELARRRLSLAGLDHSVRFVAASAHDVPLPDASVDLVLGVAILHHLDLDLAAREIRRVLKPGGRAIFQEPVRNSGLIRWLRSLIPYHADDVSPYERPLTDAELDLFSAPFTRLRARGFALPFINVAQVLPPVRRHLLELYRLDGAVLNAMPFLTHFAGVRVFEVRAE